MRKTLGVCLLVLLLTSSASAGIMGNDTPAPQSADGIIQNGQPAAASDGIIHTGQPAQEPTADGEMPNDATGALTQIVLTVFGSILL